MPTDPATITPLVESEADTRRYLATIAQLTHAEDIARTALQVACAQLHEQRATIRSLREQLSTLRDEARTRAAS